MQTISLEDELTFEFSEGDGKVDFLSVDSDYVSIFPQDDSNLIARAIAKFQSIVPESRKTSAGVLIEKRIPIGAGLAGGSANAAAALVAINHYHGNKLSLEELTTLGGTLGADVPFCLRGGTCLGTKKGDILTPVNRALDFALILAKPSKINVSTPWAFKQFDQLVKQNKTASTADNTTNRCAQALNSNLDDLASCFTNDLEEVVLNEHPELRNIRQLLVEFGAIASCMTGSGPTIFALLRNKADGMELATKLFSYQLTRDIPPGEQASAIYPLDIFEADAEPHGARVI